MAFWQRAGGISRNDVRAAYAAMLNRTPAETEVRSHMGHASIADLLAAFAASPEFTNRLQTPLNTYYAAFDVPGTIHAHADPARGPVAGHVVNFLGVALNPRFAPSTLNLQPGLEPLPFPGNWHADTAEFATALRAVDLARDSFTMIELGCGWGCWMNNTGVAARRRGLAVHLIGVEGDAGHIDFAREALTTNGFATDQYTLLHAVAAARSGKALFPKVDRPSDSWGSEPIFDASPDDHRKALATGGYDELEVIALGDAIGQRQRIDLLHIDIQGGEADLVRDTMDLLLAKVAYLLIGTRHRRSSHA